MEKKIFSAAPILLIFWIGFLILGQLQRVELAGFPAFYLHEVLLALLTFASLIIFKKDWKKIKIPIPLLFFLGSLALSLLVNVANLKDKFIPSGLYFVRLLLYLSAIPTISILTSKFKARFSTSKLSIGLAAGLGVMGLGQYFLFPDTRSLFLLGWDKHLNRSIGSLFDPNFLGLMMVLGLIYISKLMPLKRTIYTLYTLILSICLLFTYSRSSFLSLFVVLVVWGLGSKKWKEVVSAVAVFVILAMSLPQRGGEGNLLLRTASLTRRMESNQKALNIFKESPVFGIGFNTYKYTQLSSAKDASSSIHPSSPDNSYLLILATSGLVGMGTFVYLCGWLVKTYGNDSVVMLSLAAVGTHSLFNNSLFYPWVMVWLALLFVNKNVTESK